MFINVQIFPYVHEFFMSLYMLFKSIVVNICEFVFCVYFIYLLLYKYIHTVQSSFDCRPQSLDVQYCSIFPFLICSIYYPQDPFCLLHALNPELYFLVSFSLFLYLSMVLNSFYLHFNLSSFNYLLNIKLYLNRNEEYPCIMPFKYLPLLNYFQNFILAEAVNQTSFAIYNVSIPKTTNHM